MEEEEIQAAIQLMADVVSKRLPSVLSTGTYTVGFMMDLAIMSAVGGYNLFSILDEIAHLEGRRPGFSRTKPESQFKGPHLNGLWHKHHFQAKFLPQNIHLEMNRDDTIRRVLGSYQSEYITKEMIIKLAHVLVHENYDRRGGESRLTGEWIIFRREAEKNHYLTLANHTEEDAAIAERIARYEEMDRSIQENSEQNP